MPGDVVGWLETFGESFTIALPPEARAEYLQEVRSALEPRLCDGSGLSGAIGIAVDDGNVYWTETGYSVVAGQTVAGAGRVAKCATGGCEDSPTVIAAHQDGLLPRGRELPCSLPPFGRAQRVSFGGAWGAVLLVVLNSEYRELCGPLVRIIRRTAECESERQVAVVVPGVVDPRWHRRFVTSSTGALLKALLRIEAPPGLVIVREPFPLGGRGVVAPWAGGQTIPVRT